MAGAVGLLECLHNLFDGFKGDVVDLLLMEPVANPAALKGFGCGGDGLGGVGAGLLFEPVVFVGEKGHGAGDGGKEVGVELLLKEGDDVVANTVSGVGGVGVGCVFAPG